MPVKLNSTGGGSVTMDVGSTASNFTLTLPSSTGTVITTTSPKAGNVLQVVSNTLVASSSYSLSNTYSQVTGMNTSITPSSSSSKVLVRVYVNIGDNGDQAYGAFRLTKNGTAITAAYGEVSGSRRQVTSSSGYSPANSAMECLFVEYLDSPATTSSVTYGIQVTGFGGRTFYVNQTGNSDGNAGSATVSGVTLMEIAG